MSHQFQERPRWFLFILRSGVAITAGTYLFGLAFYLILRVATADRFWWLALLNDFAPFLFIPLPFALLSMSLLQKRRLVVLALVHCLVASLWFGPRFIPRHPEPAAEPTLSVVTFNVWGHNARLNDFQGWLKETGADVVLLQEIPEGYANHQIPDLADLYPYQVSQPTAIRWWGNLFLSRYPILSIEDLPGDGAPAQQRFTIDFEGQTLAIYNVHFAMPVGAPRLRLEGLYVLQTASSYNNGARNAEITRLLARLETEAYPYIVAGDFNMSEYAAIYSEIGKTMTDAYREGNNGWGGTWPIRIVDELPPLIPPLLRVDYIWHSDHFHTVEARDGPKLGSDHLPLYARLEILDHAGTLTPTSENVLPVCTFFREECRTRHTGEFCVMIKDALKPLFACAPRIQLCLESMLCCVDAAFS